MPASRRPARRRPGAAADAVIWFDRKVMMPSVTIPELETEWNYFIGMFDSEASAIRNSYEKLGNVPFLVKQITEVDIPLTFTSFDLGV